MSDIKIQNQAVDLRLLIRKQMEAKKLSERALSRATGLSTLTVSAFLNGRRKTSKSNKAAIIRVLGLEDELRIYQSEDPETRANLAAAKAEHRLLTDMALEDARQEIAPETTNALDRLREHIRIHGKRNQYGHKQFKNIVLSGADLLELTDDEPEAVSESRAAQILGAQP